MEIENSAHNFVELGEKGLSLSLASLASDARIVPNFNSIIEDLFSANPEALTRYFEPELLSRVCQRVLGTLNDQHLSHEDKIEHLAKLIGEDITYALVEPSSLIPFYYNLSNYTLVNSQGLSIEDMEEYSRKNNFPDSDIFIGLKNFRDAILSKTGVSQAVLASPRLDPEQDKLSLCPSAFIYLYTFDPESKKVEAIAIEYPSSNEGLQAFLKAINAESNIRNTDLNGLGTTLPILFEKDQHLSLEHIMQLMAENLEEYPPLNDSIFPRQLQLVQDYEKYKFEIFRKQETVSELFKDYLSKFDNLEEALIRLSGDVLNVLQPAIPEDIYTAAVDRSNDNYNPLIPFEFLAEPSPVLAEPIFSSEMSFATPPREEEFSFRLNRQDFTQEVDTPSIPRMQDAVKRMHDRNEVLHKYDSLEFTKMNSDQIKGVEEESQKSVVEKVKDVRGSADAGMLKGEMNVAVNHEISQRYNAQNIVRSVVNLYQNLLSLKPQSSVYPIGVPSLEISILRKIQINLISADAQGVNLAKALQAKTQGKHFLEKSGVSSVLSNNHSNPLVNRSISTKKTSLKNREKKSENILVHAKGYVAKSRDIRGERLTSSKSRIHLNSIADYINRLSKPQKYLADKIKTPKVKNLNQGAIYRIQTVLQSQNTAAKITRETSISTKKIDARRRAVLPNTSVVSGISEDIKRIGHGNSVLQRFLERSREKRYIILINEILRNRGEAESKYKQAKENQEKKKRNRRRLSNQVQDRLLFLLQFLALLKRNVLTEEQVKQLLNREMDIYDALLSLGYDDEETTLILILITRYQKPLTQFSEADFFKLTMLISSTLEKYRLRKISMEVQKQKLDKNSRAL